MQVTNFTKVTGTVHYGMSTYPLGAELDSRLPKPQADVVEWVRQIEAVIEGGLRHGKIPCEKLWITEDSACFKGNGWSVNYTKEAT